MRDGAIVENRRSVQVHGSYLRLLRKQRGWTQLELARRSGYSERLIRKAELFGRLTPDTIAVLAETLGTPSEPIEPRSLWFSTRELVSLFLRYIEHRTATRMDEIEGFFGNDGEIHCVGPSCIPFTGSYRGIGGMAEWSHRFWECLSRDDPQEFQQEVLVDRQRAFIGSLLRFRKASAISNPIDFHFRIEFGKNRISGIAMRADYMELVDFYAADRRCSTARSRSINLR